MSNNDERITSHKRNVRPVVVCLFFVLCYSLFPRTAFADIVLFKNGRTMSVKSCRLEADQATMVLREGGEVTFPSSIIARIDPDEAPYPEAGNREPGTVEPTNEPSSIRFPVPGSRLPDEALNAKPFANLISALAATHHVDARLVHAVIEQESGYQARARSKKGARGLMQLMPETARQYGVRNSYDPKANIEAGIKHLKDLMSRLDLPTALAAYNAGEGTVRRYGGLPPYVETQTYVRNILRRVGRSSD
jgi:hypothetical protein